MVFVALPMVVLLFVLKYKGHGHLIMESPEWAFAAAVLWGQGLIKLIRAIAEKGGAHGVRIGFLCSLNLVIGLVPSLIILAFMLIAEPSPPHWVVCVQMIWFVLSVVAFTFFSVMAGLFEASDDEPPPSPPSPTAPRPVIQVTPSQPAASKESSQ